MRSLVAALLTFCTVLPAAADDWPQWMGPERDNIWREDGIIDNFPPDGPEVVWRTEVAGGYAGPAVARGSVFLTDYVTADNVKVPNFERKTFTGLERVICLDEASGKRKWDFEYPVKYTISYPAGPRCTPLVHQGKVYTLGAEGHLHCLDAQSGKVLWSKDIPKLYQTKTALWGYTGHPLVDGKKLICICGGEGSHVVAFDKDHGQELWRALTSAEQGYSPPAIIEAGGARQLVLLRPDAVTSVDPETGQEFWSVPYEATNGSIIMSPVRWKDYLYVGGYSNKNLLLKLSATQPAAEVVWQDLAKSALSPINVQPIVVDGTLYGFDQRGELYAVEFTTGKRLWGASQPVSTRAVQTGTAFIVKQADRFWLFCETGELVIARLTPSSFQELGRAKAIEPTNAAFGRDVVWSAPAYANRRVYVRNDKECLCVDLATR